MTTKPEYSAVVIGAGVCGALAAYRLAKAGHRVLILEAGSDRRHERLKMAGDFATTSNKSPGAPYRNGGPGHILGPDNDDAYYVPNVKDNTFKSSFQRIVGGSTWHFLGNTPRFVPNDFRMRDAYGVGENWPLTYADLEPFYCEAEKELGVAGDHEQWHNYLQAFRSEPYPMQKIWAAYGDHYFQERIDGQIIKDRQIKIMSTPQARNSTAYDGRPACAGNSSCVPLCPIQAKYDATVHVTKAEKAGAVLQAHSVVSKLVAEPSTKRIVALEYIRYTSAEDYTTHRLEVGNAVVVLAAHAIETPRLLLLSQLANQSDQVGRNLMDHLQGYALALSKPDEPVYPFRGPITTSGIDVFRDGWERQHRAAFRMSIGNDGWGRVEAPAATLWSALGASQNHSVMLLGEKLRAEVRDRVTRLIRLSFSTEMLPDPDNRVTLDSAQDKFGLAKPHVQIRFAEYNQKAFAEAFEIAHEIFGRLGWEVRTPAESLSGSVYSGAGHIIGTTRMGHNPLHSVVDANGRCHEHPNLYIVGPSVFASAGTANPTLTAAALTLRTVHFIATQINQEQAHEA